MATAWQKSTSAAREWARWLTPRRLAGGLALAAIVALAARPALHADTWLHLRAGAWMAEQRQVLTQDVFSSTRPGQAWTNTAWLAELALYGLWQAFGYAGLSLAAVALVAVAFGLVYAACDGPPFVAALAVVLAAVAAAPAFSARPEVASLALAAAMLWVLERYRWAGVNRLWLLPPLLALWANLNDGFVLGVGLVVVALAAQAAARLLGHRGPGVLDWRGIGWLAGAAVLGAAAVSLNPYGPAVYLAPLRALAPGALESLVRDWQVPNFHQAETQLFIGLWVALLAVVGFARRRIDLTDLALVCAGTYAALLAAGNIPLAALLVPPLLARHASTALADLGERWPRWAALATSARKRHGARVAGALLVMALGVAGARVAWAAAPATAAADVARQMPAGAASYLETARPAGPLFNSYQFGGYLAWRLGAAYPVFVDSRTGLYDDGLVRDYLQSVHGQPGYQAVLDRYGVNLVLIDAHALLAEHLRASRLWRLAYEDAVAVVFTRATEAGP